MTPIVFALILVVAFFWGRAEAHVRTEFAPSNEPVAYWRVLYHFFNGKGGR